MHVEFHPLNVTSRCQPCDLGIIKSLNGHYGQNFTHWCLEKWEVRKDPMQENNLLMAIRLAVSTWQVDVPDDTLEIYFLKSQVMKN